MRDVYDIELWWMLTPWALGLVLAFLYWRSVRAGKRSKESAEAEAREATAAHAECGRKLEELRLQIQPRDPKTGQMMPKKAVPKKPKKPIDFRKTRK